MPSARQCLLMLLLLCTCGCRTSLAAAGKGKGKPNIVWVLTDDQDQMLGGSFPPTAPNGATPMPKTKKLMVDGGATAINFFIHTPICCPSRSELLSGRYYHNIKTTHAPACMHVDETKVNNATFAKYLQQEAGYTVGMFGKYLNTLPGYIPPGFNSWMANGGGTYISPSFSCGNVSGLPDGRITFSNAPENYSTSVIGNHSITFIREAVAAGNEPFMAYIGPKAAHEPFNPAQWYADYWDPSWPEHEPRPEAWNCSAASRADHHGNIATEPMITAEASAVISGVFKNRWRTLMSVDDLIGDVIAACEELGVADNTYFFYSSDHGFQLGEFNILMDKRNVYDWDTRIHLLARGPGIKPGSTWVQPATQVDIAPTFLGLAGLAKPPQMDGKSLVPLLLDEARVHELAPSTQHHLGLLGAGSPPLRAAYKAAWRDSVFIEYYYNDYNSKCTANCTTVPASQYPHADSSCTELVQSPNGVCWGGEGFGCTGGCYQTETPANNFIAVRNMEGSAMGNTLYAEYESGYPNQTWGQMKDIDFTKVDFVEYYNVSSDPWQMHNLHKSTAAQDPATIEQLHRKVHAWYNCAGDACP